MIIACDTSSMLCSVAVVHEQEVLFTRATEGAQVHIERLTPFIREALAFCQNSGVPADALALAIGPGSFNGLRIGLSTMKGLSYTMNLPLIPVPSTDTLALSVSSDLEGQGRAIIFSHRNFVHYADYQLQPQKTIITPAFHYVPWDKLQAGEIDHYFGHPERAFSTWLDGEAPAHIRQHFTAVQAYAGSVGLLAELRPGEQVVDLDACEPLYNAHYQAKKWIPPSF